MSARATLACAALVFAAGSVLGAFVAANAYETHMAKADEQLLEARGYRQVKACTDEVKRTYGLAAALENDRRYIGCLLRAVQEIKEGAEER